MYQIIVVIKGIVFIYTFIHICTKCLLNKTLSLVYTFKGTLSDVMQLKKQSNIKPNQ